MVGGAALDRDRNDLTGKLIGIVLRLCLDLLDLHRRVVAAFALQILQELAAGLVLRQAGDLFQHFELALFDEVDLLLRRLNGSLALAQIVLLALEGVHLLVEGLLLLLKAALLLLKIGAALLDFSLVFGTVFMDLLFCLDEHLALLVFAALDRLIDDPGSLLLRAVDLALGDLFAVRLTGKEENHSYNNCNRSSNIPCNHKTLEYTSYSIVMGSRGKLRKDKATPSRTTPSVPRPY